MGKLTATAVKGARVPGRYPDGDGLMLIVGDNGARRWMFRLQVNGKRRDFGLGSAKDVSLAEARESAAALRKQVLAGIDPVAEKKREREPIPTFAVAARRVHEEHKRGWKNGKHQAQWIATLETYAFPKLGDLTVDVIEGPAVRDVLAEIWLDKPETARRVRQRIGTVLDWAYAKGFRSTEAPMRSLSKGLPRQPRKGDRHHAALPYTEVPAFLSKLRERVSVGRLALEAALLTAARSGEVRGATWGELDLETATWTIPADRMKAGKPHVVPLSAPALDAFQRAGEFRQAESDLVFPGMCSGKQLSDMTLLKVLRDMDAGVTVHGFRSSFRDWVAEATYTAGEVAEAALAHAVPSAVERAYKRTDFFEKRRKLMDAWAAYCFPPTTDNFVPLRRPPNV
ncbi:MAG: site-specific integrase [Sphingomicrobium sp.]